MRQRHRVLYGLAVFALMTLWGISVAAAARDDDEPSVEQIAFAKEVQDLLFNELAAALFQEFDETTAANVEHGKQAISLIFDDLNRNIRLVGPFAPLLGGRNNRTSGAFERAALPLALAGQSHSVVEEENGIWFYRESFPLSNTFHATCVLCHTNFTPEFFAGTNNPGQWVGMLVMSVPIRSDD